MPNAPEVRRGGTVRLLARIAFVAGALLVLVGSLTPGTEMPEIDVSDKLQHFGAYAGLAFLGLLAWPQGRAGGWSVGGLLLAGPLIEVVQMFVPGRSASLGDAVADVLGVAAGAVLAYGVKRVSRSRASRRNAGGDALRR